MTINNIPHPTDASIILTYRCPMRCKMCNVWQYPTEKSKEIQPEELHTLPKLKFINLTGGEPFIREDIDKIVEECYKHTDASLYLLLDGLKTGSLLWPRSFRISGFV